MAPKNGANGSPMTMHLNAVMVPLMRPIANGTNGGRHWIGAMLWWYSNGDNGTNDDNGDNDDPLAIQQRKFVSLTVLAVEGIQTFYFFTHPDDPVLLANTMTYTFDMSLGCWRLR